jgi:hypothetical protein
MPWRVYVCPMSDRAVKHLDPDSNDAVLMKSIHTDWVVHLNLSIHEVNK